MFGLPVLTNRFVGSLRTPFKTRSSFSTSHMVAVWLLAGAEVVGCYRITRSQASVRMVSI